MLCFMLCRMCPRSSPTCQVGHGQIVKMGLFVYKIYCEAAALSSKFLHEYVQGIDKTVVIAKLNLKYYTNVHVCNYAVLHYTDNFTL